MISHLARLRERAARIDAMYAARELEAEKRLRTIRYQNAMAGLERARDFRQTTIDPALCAYLSGVRSRQ